jgi:menaquinone-9 beta-reductase
LIYDLIVVGGGPAGAITALYAARHGLTTLLLDQSRFPRDKICGDGVTGKAIAILRDLQLEEAVARLPGIRFSKVVFGSSKHTEAEVDIDKARKRDFVTGYVITRHDFDAFLFEQARAAASLCLEEFVVEDLLWEDGRVCGVVGRQKSSNMRQEFRSRIVIGADGYRSIVARKTGRYAIDPRHWLVAIRCYQRNVGGLSDRIELHYVSAVTPGYFWIFPLQDGFANVGIGMLASAMKKRRVNLVEALDATLKDPYFAPRFADAVPTEKPIGWHLPVGSTQRPCSGPGYMLVGDAAGLIDPFTGEGIANAMYSARVAAAEAAAAIKRGDIGAASLGRYDRALWDGIGAELKTSTKLQWIAGCQPLLNFTIGRAARSQDVRDTLCAMIAEEISRKEMTSPLFYLKLLAK